MPRSLLSMWPVTRRRGLAVAAEFTIYARDYLLNQWGPETVAYAGSAGILDHEELPQSTFTTADALNYDQAKLEQALLDRFPNASDTGICILDWESQPYIDMRDNASDTAIFQTAQQKFIDCYNAAKAFRPNVQFGYYDIPFRTYDATQVTNWNGGLQGSKMDGLLQYMDVIACSIYPLLTDEETSVARNQQYIEENLEKGLTYGGKWNKPVYVYQTHRIYEGNTTVDPVTSTDTITITYSRALLQYGVYGTYAGYVKKYRGSLYGNAIKGMMFWDDSTWEKRKIKPWGIRSWHRAMVAETDESTAAEYDTHAKNYLQQVVEAPSV